MHPALGSIQLEVKDFPMPGYGKTNLRSFPFFFVQHVLIPLL
jgi:hypothetical protein